MGLTTFDTPSASASLTGPLTIAKDPQTGVAGNLVVSGSASFATLNASLPSGLTITGGLKPDAIIGGNPPVTTSSQSVSTSGTAITMTSGLAANQNTVFVSANSTTATCVLTPTASASTSGDYQDGLEVSLINLAPAGSNVLLPSTSMGSLGSYNYTLSAGHGVRFKYVAALQTWIPLSAA